MNAVIKPSNHYLAEFERLAAGLAGQDAAWLRDLRNAAIARFVECGFPSARDENWKYTRTTAIEKRTFCCDAIKDAVDVEKISRHIAQTGDGPRLILVNGRYFPALSRLNSLPAGAGVVSLNDVLRTRPNRLQEVLDAVVVQERHPFAALNSAFADDGVHITLADNTVLAQPIEVVFVATAALDGHVIHPRILMQVGANSQAAVVERYVAVDDAAYFNNAVVEIALGANASLAHYRLQEEGAKAFHIGGVHVRQARDSRYTAHGITLGNAVLRNDIDVQLADTGTHCDLRGLYLVTGRQHVDIHTRIDHLQPCGTSNEFYKGILDGHGRGVFNGKVIVHPDAQKTDARQANKNLLLSDNAEADTKPELEIYADDVKCSHGATVGQLDAGAVFYLQSRGVDEATARQLLTHAFAAEILDEIKLDGLRNYLDGAVVARLPLEVLP